MTTTTRPTCKRPRCTNVAHHTRGAAGLCRKHALAAGLLLPPAPVAVVADHIAKLSAAGWAYEKIAEQAGTSTRTLANIRHHRYHNVRGFLAKKIMALKGVPPEPAFQPRWRATRRIRALRAAGYTVEELAQGTGIGVAHIIHMCNRSQGTITRGTWQKVRDYYDAHAGATIRPASYKIRAKRWPTPYMWDNIDDPDEVPDKPSRPLNSPRREIIEDDRAAIAKLYAYHEGWFGIHREHGISPEALRYIITAPRGKTATRTMLARIHAAADSTPTPMNWADYLPPRGEPMRRPISPKDLENIEVARETLGSYRAVERAARLPRGFPAAAARGTRDTIRDAYAQRLADLAAQAVGEEAA